ncbi:MAG: twin-arginine translocase TatA/TatE family subunit [Myxococcales bacterium]|jgi:sec-independent protein translocase protein TatA|nr:twin-arginine translocase TatA/TatE family subunit [Myxococcales bacterium]
MGSIGAPEILVVALIALLLFGAGRIADIGKGLGQGIKNFKQGIKEANADDDDDKSEAKAEKSDRKKTSSKDKDESKKKREADEEADAEA